MMIKKLTVTTALFAVGVFSSLGYSAVAQTNSPASSPNQATPAQTRPAPMPNQSAPAQNPSRQQQSRQLSPIDMQFVTDAAHGGMAEVQLGQLALQRSKSAEVKRFAQQMIQEHTRANEQLMQLAAQKGITPPTTPGPKYEAAMTRLMQLSGEAFDRAYMNEGGINGHLESAAVYQRQVALGQDPDLKAFAARILPRVQGHLEMASQMTGYRFAQRSNTRPGMSMPQ
jgi:putative membrane protein